MSQPIVEKTLPQEENTIKILVLSIRAILMEMLRKWWLILAITALVAAYYYWKVQISDPETYNAKLTFMLSEDGGSNGGISSVLGLFGGAAANSYSLDKVLELSKSRKIVSDALFSVKEIKGKRDFLANHLIAAEKYQAYWEEKSPDLKGFLFTHGLVDSFSRKENKALLFLYAKVIGNKEQGIAALLENTYGETSGIMAMNLKTQTEELSIQLLEELFNRLSSFYISQSTEKKTEAYKLLIAKRDSIERVLRNKDYAAAAFKDKSNGMVFSTSAVPGAQLERDKRMMEVMYAESIKNSELANYSLQSETPFIQPIDMPISPIKSSRPNSTKTVVMGIIFGLLPAMIFVYFRMIFLKAMVS